METNIYKKLFEIKKAGIKLQRDTKAFNYKYATLSQIQEKLNGEFEKQKLLILHTIISNKVRTEIINIEAKQNDVQSICSEIELTEGIKAQDKGSEITYYRRYNLLSLLDLEVEDDDATFSRENKKEDEDNKKRFGEDNFIKFKTVAENYNQQSAVKECRKKYKVSKKYAELIEGLY